MKLNKKQIELLKRTKVERNQWNQDIIWLKRLDLVGQVKDQEKANALFRDVIRNENLHTTDFGFVKLISAVDNLWKKNSDLEKRDWYEARRKE